MKKKLRTLFFSGLLFLMLFTPLAMGAERVDWAADDFASVLPSLEGAPTYYRLQNGQYVAIGGYKVIQGFPSQVADVYFLELDENGPRVFRTSSLPKGVVGAEAAELGGVLYVFGGTSGNLTQANQFMQGDVYRYDEATNSFSVDSHAEPMIEWAQHFMYQGNLIRLVPAYNGTKYAKQHPERIDMYIPGAGWSEQILQPKDDIAQLYQEILKRDPDGPGLAYWSQRYKEGLSLAKIREAFMVSDEYRLKFSQQK